MRCRTTPLTGYTILVMNRIRPESPDAASLGRRVAADALLRHEPNEEDEEENEEDEGNGKQDRSDENEDDEYENGEGYSE